MKMSGRIRKIFKSVLLTAIVIILVGSISACEELGYPSSQPQQAQPAPEPAPVTGSNIINTKDTAILAVYRHLLDQADGYEAKVYLSDFYTNCDNWTAISEYFKDGSDTWYVVVDMTEVADWTLRPYWQQASWFAFKNGDVIPSYLFNANALRIEADLQALSREMAPPSE